MIAVILIILEVNNHHVAHWMLGFSIASCHSTTRVRPVVVVVVVTFHSTINIMQQYHAVLTDAAMQAAVREP